MSSAPVTSRALRLRSGQAPPRDTFAFCTEGREAYPQMQPQYEGDNRKRFARNWKYGIGGDIMPKCISI